MARSGRVAGPAPDVFVPCGGNDEVGGPVPLHRLAVPDPNALPFAIGSFDTIGPLSRAGYPHRHSFYEIVYVTAGTGTHVTDGNRCPLRPPLLCVIAPGQVHYWDRVCDLSGWLILFTDDFLAAHPSDAAALRLLGERPRLYLDAGSGRRIAALVAELTGEFEERSASFVSVLQAYVHILLTRALRLPGAAGPPLPSGREAGVSQEFLRLLMSPTRAPARSVRDCAGELGVSVSHLNEAVKRATGRTPGQLIRHAQTVAAKRLLTTTDLTVAQVAHRVGFADPAYFCRFFRRETGLSPGAFRRADTAAPPGGRIHHDLRAQSIEEPAGPQ